MPVSRVISIGIGTEGLTQAAIDPDHVADPAVMIIGESDGADFDDLVARVVKARGFDIDQKRHVGKQALPPRTDGAGHKPAQDSVLAARLQSPGRLLVSPVGRLWRSIGSTLSRRLSWRLTVARRLIEEIKLGGRCLHAAALAR